MRHDVRGILGNGGALNGRLVRVSGNDNAPTLPFTEVGNRELSCEYRGHADRVRSKAGPPPKNKPTGGWAGRLGGWGSWA